VRAVLIDLDDTLLDYSGAAGRCWAEACAAIGGPAGVDVKTLVPAVDETRRWFWSDPARHARERVQMLGAWTKIAAAALESVGHAPGDLAPAIARDFAARRHAAMALFHDAVPCLERLRAAGARLGLVTNGEAAMQREKIERFDLARFFDALLIEGELGTGKPDLAVYRHALAALGSAPNETCMIGDNLEWDVAAPQRLGLTGIWLDRARGGLPPDHDVRPDRVIHALSDLVP
jgi:putative hydrolase of the HAD superfamily